MKYICLGYIEDKYFGGLTTGRTTEVHCIRLRSLVKGQPAAAAIGNASHSRAIARFMALTTASSVAVTMFEFVPTP